MHGVAVEFLILDITNASEVPNNSTCSKTATKRFCLEI